MDQPPAATNGPVANDLEWPGGTGAGRTLGDQLTALGVSRRSFLNWATGVTAALALPPTFVPRVARAVQQAQQPRLVWLEFQSCTGDTESFLRSRSPGVGDLILNTVSVDYNETIMAAAGAQAEKSLADATAGGGHLVVVEGSIPLGAGGSYAVIGGRTAQQRLIEASRGAAAVIAVGTCAGYGGLPAAAPNPTGAVGVRDVLSGVPVINLPGCPANVDNITATLVHYLTFKQLPATDEQGRPLFAYGERIHDNCPRRGHFDAGNFAVEFGDQGHRSGWCLYKLGCKGPSTYHNCPSQQWNAHTNWPIGAGSPCVGCSQPAFWDNMTPIYQRLPHVAGAGLDWTADKIGVSLLGATFVGASAHGVAKVIQNRRYFRAERAETGAGAPSGHWQHGSPATPVTAGVVTAAPAATRTAAPHRRPGRIGADPAPVQNTADASAADRSAVDASAVDRSAVDSGAADSSFDSIEKGEQP